MTVSDFHRHETISFNRQLQNYDSSLLPDLSSATLWNL